METLLNNFLSFIPTKTSPNTKLPPPHIKTSPKQKLSPSKLILNTFEDIVNTYIDPPARSSSLDPTVVLSSNFAPVNELPPTQCQIIKGTLPKCVNGAYLRNGPNPQFYPIGPYHFFDGDGMIHFLHISNDHNVTLSSRFVKTRKFLAEQSSNSCIIPNFFAGANGLQGSLARAILAFARIFTENFDVSQGIGVANTNISLFGNRIFALCESDLPYELKLTKDGDIQTLGRINFDGNNIKRMTAHPKFDPEKNEGFAFFYDCLPPFLTLFRFDSLMNKHKDVPIFSMKQPSYVHDFSITSKFAIFFDIQIVIDPLRRIIKGESILRLDRNKVSRVGILPKNCENEKEIRWYVVPGLNTLHAINAWDEIHANGNETITILSTNMKCPENGFKMEGINIFVEKIVINLQKGLVTRKILSNKNLELPVINSQYEGKKNRYIYACFNDDSGSVKPNGVVKIDGMCKLEDCIVASRKYGHGCYGGEPFFVAKESNLEEDDGYIVTFMHDENRNESYFLVMDAKSTNLDIVCSIKLPQRVPYGIHGLFVKDKDLKALWDNHNE